MKEHSADTLRLPGDVVDRLIRFCGPDADEFTIFVSWRNSAGPEQRLIYLLP